MIQIELPDDVNEYILDVQMKKKLEKGTGFYSKDKTIIFILRESMAANGFQPQKNKEKKQDEAP